MHVFFSENIWLKVGASCEKASSAPQPPPPSLIYRLIRHTNTPQDKAPLGSTLGGPSTNGRRTPPGTTLGTQPPTERL